MILLCMYVGMGLLWYDMFVEFVMSFLIELEEIILKLLREYLGGSYVDVLMVLL